MTGKQAGRVSDHRTALRTSQPGQLGARSTETSSRSGFRPSLLMEEVWPRPGHCCRPEDTAIWRYKCGWQPVSCSKFSVWQVRALHLGLPFFASRTQESHPSVSSGPWFQDSPGHQILRRLQSLIYLFIVDRFIQQRTPRYFTGIKHQTVFKSGSS